MRYSTVKKVMKNTPECGEQHIQALVLMTWWLPDEAATDPNHRLSHAWDEAVEVVSQRFDMVLKMYGKDAR